jgi:ubiquitin C-terminal hydrolase
MRIIETKVYLFKELDEQTKEKVIRNNYHIALQDDWYHFTKDDLKEVDIELKSFDGSFAEINIDNFLFNTCEKIIKSHGENCDTYKIAERYIKEYNFIQEKIDALNDYDSDDEYQDKLTQCDQDLDNLDEEYQKEFSEEVLSMLRQEYEHMTSDEYIIDMFEANEYEFTAEGEII